MLSKINLCKEYMTVSEVAGDWGVLLDDIRYLGEEGLLEICIRRIPLKVAIESILEKEPYRKGSKKEDIIQMINDPQPLHPTDIYLLFANKDKKIRLARFKTKPIMKITKIKAPGIDIGFEDMVITASEKKRFEFEQTNTILDKSIKEPLVLKSSNFTEIELYGEKFHFGDKQAIAIKYLYDKYYEGNPWIHGKLLLRKAQSESYKVANLFSKHSNWKKAVVSNGRGYYRINLPFSEPAPTRSPDPKSPTLFE